MIRNSKIVIVLCFNRMNKYTMEEFEVAYNERKNGKDIKIYTFFKKLDNNIKLEESFNEFKKKLKSIEHFYSTFTHVDTIKINIYRFILRLILGESKIEEKLINGNLRLVLSVIQRFCGRGENADDLFQVGINIMS